MGVGEGMGVGMHTDEVKEGKGIPMPWYPGLVQSARREEAPGGQPSLASSLPVQLSSLDVSAAVSQGIAMFFHAIARGGGGSPIPVASIPGGGSPIPVASIPGGGSPIPVASIPGGGSPIPVASIPGGGSPIPVASIPGGGSPIPVASIPVDPLPDSVRGAALPDTRGAVLPDATTDAELAVPFTDASRGCEAFPACSTASRDALTAGDQGPGQGCDWARLPPTAQECSGAQPAKLPGAVPLRRLNSSPPSVNISKTRNFSNISRSGSNGGSDHVCDGLAILCASSRHGHAGQVGRLARDPLLPPVAISVGVQASTSAFIDGLAVQPAACGLGVSGVAGEALGGEGAAECTAEGADEPFVKNAAGAGAADVDPVEAWAAETNTAEVTAPAEPPCSAEDALMASLDAAVAEKVAQQIWIEGLRELRASVTAMELEAATAQAAAVASSKADPSLEAELRELRATLARLRDENEQKEAEAAAEKDVLASEMAALGAQLRKAVAQQARVQAKASMLRDKLGSRLARATALRDVAVAEQEAARARAERVLAEGRAAVEAARGLSERLRGEAQECEQMREAIMDKHRMVDELRGEATVLEEDIEELLADVESAPPAPLLPSATASLSAAAAAGRAGLSSASITSSAGSGPTRSGRSSGVLLSLASQRSRSFHSAYGSGSGSGSGSGGTSNGGSRPGPLRSSFESGRASISSSADGSSGRTHIVSSGVGAGNALSSGGGISSSDRDGGGDDRRRDVLVTSVTGTFMPSCAAPPTNAPTSAPTDALTSASDSTVSASAVIAASCGDCHIATATSRGHESDASPASTTTGGDVSQKPMAAGGAGSTPSGLCQGGPSSQAQGPLSQVARSCSSRSTTGAVHEAGLQYSPNQHFPAGKPSQGQPAQPQFGKETVQGGTAGAGAVLEDGLSRDAWLREGVALPGSSVVMCGPLYSRPSPRGPSEDVCLIAGVRGGSGLNSGGVGGEGSGGCDVAIGAVPGARDGGAQGGILSSGSMASDTCPCRVEKGVDKGSPVDGKAPGGSSRVVEGAEIVFAAAVNAAAEVLVMANGAAEGSVGGPHAVPVAEVSQSTLVSSSLPECHHDSISDDNNSEGWYETIARSDDNGELQENGVGSVMQVTADNMPTSACSSVYSDPLGSQSAASVAVEQPACEHPASMTAPGGVTGAKGTPHGPMSQEGTSGGEGCCLDAAEDLGGSWYNV
eukprot:jgi/Mesvir1/12770/Mv22828-RA.1